MAGARLGGPGGRRCRRVGRGRRRRAREQPAHAATPRRAPLEQAAVAARHLERRPDAGRRGRRHHVTGARRQAFQRPRRAAKVGACHPEHRAGPGSKGRGRRRTALLDHGQAHVHRRPAPHVVPDLDRPPLAREQDRATAMPGQPHTERAGRPHRLVEGLLARRARRRPARSAAPNPAPPPAAAPASRPTGPRRASESAMPACPRDRGAGRRFRARPSRRRGAGPPAPARRRCPRGPRHRHRCHRAPYRLHPREHQYLLAARAHDLAGVETQRITDHEPPRLEHPPPAAREADVDPQPSRPAARDGDGPAQQRLPELAARRGQQPGTRLHPQRVRAPPPPPYGARDGGLIPAPCAASTTQAVAADRQHDRPTPGTYREGESNVAAARHSASPSSAVTIGRITTLASPQALTVPGRAPARPARSPPARRHRPPARAATGG